MDFEQVFMVLEYYPLLIYMIWIYHIDMIYRYEPQVL